ncbi:MAG: serine hydrolase [Wenzhouxiangellaceae bacterium]|nr:serine hydrolase [Wenzhouxiangellaceae bacterium]MBS3822972.1 serine hydrolase [Wenzhouxiangellaceae bacterium]
MESPSHRTPLLATAAAALLLGALIGWLPATRAAEFDDGRVQRLAQQAESLDALHTLLVLHAGDVVLELDVRGGAASEPANLKSLSKTLLSVVAGIAIDNGVVASVDQPLVDLLGARMPEDATEGVADITLGHALSLRTGLRSTSGRYYGRWVQSPNWVTHALTRPMVDEPGGRMIYSTGSTHLVAAALVEASGRTLLDLTRDWLGAPLNIRIRDWMRDPQGIHFGGNEMHLSPRAVARIGELYRRGGTLDGRRIVSREWIDKSWTPRGRSPWSGDLYGYGWFITDLAGERAYYGRGYGGQMLYVVPSAALTVVVTSRSVPPSEGGGYVRRLHRLVEGLIEG